MGQELGVSRAVSCGFGSVGARPAPVAATVGGTVSGVDDKRDVYDAEDHRSEGEEYQDDEERDRD